MAQAARTPRTPAAGASPATDPSRRTPAVKMWALLGAATAVFQAYILIKWIAGPNFTPVLPGPTPVPGWMSAILVFWQVVSLPAALWMIYRFVLRPMRREGHVGFDGVLVLASGLCWFWDTASNSGNYWLVYNAAMFNMGNWSVELPWWSAYSAPGATTPEPLLYTIPAYFYLLPAGAAFGATGMRLIKQRWPNITTGGLVAAAFGVCCVFDLIVEGLIWMPMGIFEYPGGVGWALFPNSYHKFPINEMICWGIMFGAFACLRYFTNDRGYCLAERGIERVGGSSGKRLALRVLAVGAIAQIIVIGAYHLPNVLVGLNSTAWPDDLQQRSYFVGGICGGDTNRFCPQPGVANGRGDAPYVGADGRIVIPPTAPTPRLVPLDQGGTTG